MFFADSERNDAGKQLPEPIYESVVRSLYGDQKTLLVGSLSIGIAPVILYSRTGDWAELLFAALLTLLGGMRLIDGVAFHRAARVALTGHSITLWETRYATLGALYVAVLGFWCMIGMARSDDQFVHLMSITITISYLVGIIGRNFSSEKVVFSQTVFAGAPMTAGFVLFGDIYHQLLGAFLLPFFFTIWLMSRNLRHMLFSAVLTALDHKTIADRFDDALRNVSHGMAMLDRQGVITVVNSRFASLGGLVSSTTLTGKSIEVLAGSTALAEAGASGSRTLDAAFSKCLKAGRSTSFRIALPDGRVVEAKFSPTAEEGGVVVLEDITERVSSEEEIRKLASYDPLTHLPNRRHFSTEINRVLGGPEGLGYCTFFFVDLDNFKDVNDTLGHAIGDKLLCSVALRMRARLPGGAMVCRFGGDEFVVVIPGKLSLGDCRNFASELLDEIANPVLIDGNYLMIGASIGVARCPENGRDYSQLLKASDVALYDAKARGRGTYSFFTEELGDVIRDRRVLENELRRAIKRSQLEVYYQPLIDMAGQRISTCEALLRWRHPEHGIVPPSIFIPIAEEIGVISQVGEFVLSEATRQCASWPDEINVAVNVSSLQFQQTDVCAVVAGALAASGLDPNRLEIEVTESAMVRNISEISSVLAKLSASGVKISLDDFGTGFSSLSYLHAMPLDNVKIDRSFIENIMVEGRSRILLAGVTHLARDLGLAVTVEGVETEAQRDVLLRTVHVDRMQGYLFGRPMPSDSISTLLRESAQRQAPWQKIAV
jgi:diguanylate cyclase (GGDEF)-like protein